MTEIRVIATIEYDDGRVEFRTWRTRRLGINKFKRRIRARYADRPGVAYVQLGTAITEHWYGAH